MERVRESVRSFRPASGTLVRVVEIREIGLRENTDGAVILTGEDGTRQLHGAVLRGVANQQLLDADEERQLLDVPVTTEQAIAAGLVCAGRATLLLSPLSDLPTETIEWLADSEPVVLVTRADGSGDELTVSPRGTAGGLGSEAITEQAISAARQVLRRGESAAEIQTIDGVDLLLSAAAPVTRAMIVGDGPMAEAFRAQGELMGWQVNMVSKLEAVMSFCATATAADVLLVLSHDRSIDSPSLAAGLSSDVGYIGALGSRRTQARRAEHLADLGHTDTDRVHGPVGLDLGSRTPAETAVAMAAEFLAVRRGRPPASLSDHDGPIHA